MMTKVLNPLAWTANLLVFAMILYIGKSALGIDLVKDCHADQVILGTCSSNQAYIR